ncbi:MAG TPA: PaaI family thioesterase [Anaerolineales bacterium]|nr:PaaI family thioesterase [Anaerolineales bacterium]
MDVTPSVPRERIKQPSSSTCFICGVENSQGLRLSFYETGPDTVETTAVVPEYLQGYPGVTHGGIVTALLDEVTLRAAVIGQPEHLMVTGKIEVRFRQNVPIGVPLRVIGTLLERKRRAARTRGEVILPDGTIGAEAEAILMDHPQSGLSRESLAALGWRVFPA